jgi:HlyD family secretion protein
VPFPEGRVATSDDIIPTQRRHTLLAWFIAFFGFGAFLAWGFLGRLDAGAVAPGVIVALGSHTPVSNFEGGTIKELMVREGSLVKTGDVLLQLDTTVIAAQLGQYRSQYLVALAQRDRDLAEQADKRTLEFSPELLAFKSDPMARAAMGDQLRQFEVRWRDFDAQVAVNFSHVEEYKAAMAANLGMAKSSREHLGISEHALSAFQQLKSLGLARIDELYTYSASAADMRGLAVQYEQTAEQDRQIIQTYQAMITQQYHDRQAAIAQDLQTELATVAQMPDQIRAAEDILKRKTIRAPTDGRVVNQKFFTVGGVVTPGAPILEIVPAEDDLVAEVQVSNIDIDGIHPDQKAEVELLAYTQREVPYIPGKVIVVGGDVLVTPQSNNQYYLVRIRMSGAELTKVRRMVNVQLKPGMPVQAMIAKGDRKAIDYFLQPITDSFWRAFREN